MSLTQFNTLLTVIIFVFVGILSFGAAFVYFSKKNPSKKKKGIQKGPQQLPNATREDVLKFLPFDTIENGMFVQEKGERFVALVECKGINYYLMSETEKISVEETFIQFLNSIRYPIQIYIQNRTISLDDNIDLYKKKLNTLELDLYDKVSQFKELDKQGADDVTLYSIGYEIEKKENVVNYTKSLINNISLISNNHNVLDKHYYIAISYHISEAGLVNRFSPEEMKEVAYSELSTKADSIAGALASCGIEAHMLDSNELAEVMYVAINRDDADILNFRKLLSSKFTSFYSTAKDPILKKREIVNERSN